MADFNENETDQKTLEKLQKIFNMAESAKKINNLEEANNALLMFRKILAKNKLNIDEDYFRERKEEKEEPEVNRKVIVVFKHRRTFWKQKLAESLIENFRCKFILQYYERFIPSIGWIARVVAIGENNDLEVVKYLYDSFEKIALKCKNEFIKEIKNNIKNMGYDFDTKTSASIKNDYLEGFIVGLNKAFKEQMETDEEVALALVTPQKVLEAYDAIEKKKSKNLADQSISLRMNNARIFNEGYKKGYETGNTKDRRLEE